MARAQPAAQDGLDLIGRHPFSGRFRGIADQLIQLYEFAGFFRRVGRQIGRVPREKQVFVTLPLSSGRDTLDDETDLVKRQIPE